MNNKIKVVQNILNSSFTSENFAKLVTILFDDVKLKDKVIFRKEFTNYSSHIEQSAHIGDYEDPDGKRIVIFAVELKKENYVENSRSTQRNYAKSLIDNNNYDAAIIAFYIEEEAKWRLSFVRLDYELKIENGKTKTNEVLTPARRYSFLVGKDEPCHTAIKQLSLFIENDNYKPTLNELEEAFSVEKVTKEFYKLYCEKYHQLRDHLDQNQEFLDEAARHNFDSVQFAKKLMGQIVFLYFLQKKGWLGVNVWPQLLSEKEYKNVYYASSPLKKQIQEELPKVYVAYGENQYRLNYAALKKLSSDVDEAIANVLPRKKSWGDGPRDFMRKLFQDAERNNANFFDEYLEPLFYNAMNQNRGDNGYFATLHCRIPFLSGGLFEPIDGYDWKHTNFNIPNVIFSNIDENRDSSVYEADGILDIFDRFNFTMSEDEPLEREVAVDPEMLGKVFENLLEIKDRKSKGAFYTPREIVHYMCQQSLINYLVTKTGIEETAIRDFVLFGDIYKDYDVQLIKEKKYDNLYISELLFKLNAKGKKLTDRLPEIDKALESVKIADPAVGSGAFPLGLLNEIVRLREAITTYIAVEMNSFSKLVMYNSERSPYKLKRETIKNCIFAADIEPSAVDIARLRLWLALVIDDNVVPGSSNTWDHVNPIPLPNLECNIVCGNSLVDEFEGFKLIDNSLNEMFTGQQGLGQAEYLYYLNEIIKVQKDLYECKIDRDKQEYKDKLIRLRNSLIEAQLRNEGATAEFFEKFKEAEQLASKPYVLWQIDFARVFMENGGFDIVLGNPPYLGFHKVPNKDYNKKNYVTADGKYDLYVLFIERAVWLTSKNGFLSYICPSYFYKRNYGKKTRALLLNSTSIRFIADFADYQVFDSALTYTCIFGASKIKRENNTILILGTSLNIGDAHQISQDSLTEPTWNLGKEDSNSIMEKVSSKSKYTFGDITKSISQGIVTGNNDVYLIEDETAINFDLEDAYLHRAAKGKDIGNGEVKDGGYSIFYPYKLNEKGKTVCISEQELKEKAPNMYNYLLQYKEKLLSREYFVKSNKEWFELWNPRKMEHFFHRKFVFSEIGIANDFVLVDKCFYTDSACGAELKEQFQKNEKAIYLYLNSKLATYVYKKISVPKANGYCIYKNAFLKNFPIVTLERLDNIDSVDANEFNNYLYDYLGLTDEERRTVESV